MTSMSIEAISAARHVIEAQPRLIGQPVEQPAAHRPAKQRAALAVKRLTAG